MLSIRTATALPGRPAGETEDGCLSPLVAIYLNILFCWLDLWIYGWIWFELDLLLVHVVFLYAPSFRYMRGQLLLKENK